MSRPVQETIQALLDMGAETIALTADEAKQVLGMVAALERASAELRHSYKYRPIDPNLVARAIELLERAALSPLERDALSPPAKESGSSESSTVPVQAVKPTQDGSEASVSGSSEGAPAKDGRGTLPQKGDHGGELDSKLKSRLVITEERGPFDLEVDRDAAVAKNIDALRSMMRPGNVPAEGSDALAKAKETEPPLCWRCDRVAEEENELCAWCMHEDLS